MPHLSAIQKKYQDKVTVVAISDEKRSTVAEFMAKPSSPDGKTWAEAMAFTVATDPDQSAHTGIHRAAGQRGIPSSFIISDGGVIEWIGHPMSMDGPLKQVLDGTWDRVSYRKKLMDEQAIEQEMARLRPRLMAAVQSDDWSGVIDIFDEALKKFPGNVQLMTQKWNVMLTRTNRYTEAYKLGRELLPHYWEDAQQLNGMAWTVVDSELIKERDLRFAMKAAKRANELTESKDGAIMDTLARVHFEKGDVAKAVEWQTKAVAAAKPMGGEMYEQLQEVLEKYKAKHKAKPKRERL